MENHNPLSPISGKDGSIGVVVEKVEFGLGGCFMRPCREVC